MSSQLIIKRMLMPLKETGKQKNTLTHFKKNQNRNLKYSHLSVPDLWLTFFSKQKFSHNFKFTFFRNSFPLFLLNFLNTSDVERWSYLYRKVWSTPQASGQNLTHEPLSGHTNIPCTRKRINAYVS